MIKILKHISKKDFLLLMISIISMFISVLCDLVQPLLFGRISGLIADGITKWDPKYTWIMGLMGGAAFVGITFNFIAVYLTTKLTVRLSFKLRIDMFNKVQSLSSCDIDKISNSSIVTRITHDVFHIEQLMFMMFTMLVKAPIYFIGGLTLSIITLLYADVPSLANISYIYVVFAFMFMITIGILYKAFPLFEKIKKNYDSNNSIMSENLIGSRVVRAFNLQENQTARYYTRIEKLKKNTIKAETLTSLFLPLFMLLINLSIVFVIGFSGFVAVDTPANEKTEIVGLVTSIIQYFNILLVGFILAAMVLASYANTRVSAKRINEIYNLKSDIVESKKPVKISTPNISFKNVYFRYYKDAEDWTIENLSFDINPGETIGIIGETGSGKSTIINLLSRLYDVDKGEIQISNKNIKEIEIKELRDKISISLQEKILFSGSIKDNIKVGKQNATDKDVKEASIMAEAYEFIETKPGLFDYRIEERGKNLSGGQKQRISIARALIKKPKILIFDDSTSALDNITEKKLLSNVKKNLGGNTLIIVAQRISSIKDANKIIILQDGKIIGMGNHSELIKNNKEYKKINESQDTSKDK